MFATVGMAEVSSIYTGTLDASPNCHWLAYKSEGRGLLLVCFWLLWLMCSWFVGVLN